MSEQIFIPETLPTEASPGDRAAAPSADDALTRLTPLGWRWGLVAQVAGLALSFFAFGYFAIYWRNADMDFMVVYNALVMNDGKPQEFFDHPGYLMILSVRYAFRALHAVGLLDAWTLPAIPSATNVPAFDAAMTQAVRAGRLVAFVTGTAAVLIFGVLIRRVVNDWRIALIAAFAFAFSGGVAVHLRILRSEMLAASLVVFALLILIPQCRRGGVFRPLVLAVVAALCMLGLENKVHVVVLVAALPVLALAFSEPAAASAAFWRTRWAWPAVLLAAVIAFALGVAAWPIVAAGLDPANITTAELHPLVLHRYGVYQCVLLTYAIVGVIAFAWLRRVSPAETLAIVFALAAGGALGLLALDIQFNAQNAVAVVNPLEKMINFSPLSSEGAATDPIAVLNLLRGSLVSVLERYTFFLYTAARPTVFVLWLVLAGIVCAARQRRWRLVLQTTLLVLLATAVDCLGVSRGLKSEYFMFSDPFFIIAGALLLAAMPEVARLSWAYPVGVVLIVAHVVVAHPEPIKMITKKSGPEYICEWNQTYERLLPVPWCDLPPKHP